MTTSIDAFSMRGFVPSPGVTGHDQFFRTFAMIRRHHSRHHLGEWLDEIATRAGRTERTIHRTDAHARVLAMPRKLATKSAGRMTLAHFRDALLAKGFVADISAAKEQLGRSRKNAFRAMNILQPAGRNSGLSGRAPLSVPGVTRLSQAAGFSRKPFSASNW